MINPLAWVVWAGAVLVAVSATRNPFYLLLILLWIGLAAKAVPPAPGTNRVPISPWRFALVVIALSALFNVLFVHVGKTVLFKIPRHIPIVGGPYTLEALLYGVLNGLTLSAIFFAFTVLNRQLPVRALVRMVPRAFYPLAVVISVALTYVPTTLSQFQQIKEAQAVRGHKIHGLKDWTPLLMPLLIGGLERAMNLSEAMMARGFASVETEGHNPKTRLLLIFGLLAVLSGWLLRLVWGQLATGSGLLIFGAGLILLVLWLIGRRIPHTVYRPDPWRKGDWLVLICAAITILVFLFSLPGFNRASIYYYPYPRLIWPVFDWGMALATLGLLGPAIQPFSLRARRRFAKTTTDQPETVTHD